MVTECTCAIVEAPLAGCLHWRLVDLCVTEALGLTRCGWFVATDTVHRHASSMAQGIEMFVNWLVDHLGYMKYKNYFMHCPDAFMVPRERTILKEEKSFTYLFNV